MKQLSKSLEIATLKYKINEAYDQAADSDSVYCGCDSTAQYYLARVKALEMQLHEVQMLIIDNIKIIA